MKTNDQTNDFKRGLEAVKKGIVVAAAVTCASGVNVAKDSSLELLQALAEAERSKQMVAATSDICR